MNLLFKGISIICFFCSFSYGEKSALPVPQDLLGNLKDQKFEHIWGNPEAPLKIVTYGSLSCGGCAEFHTQCLKKIYEKYGLPGHLCCLIKDFPIDGAGLRASLLTWCFPEKSHELRHAFYSKQKEWLGGVENGKIDTLTLEKALKKIAALHGIPEASAEACLRNKNLLDQVAAYHQKEKKLAGIPHVPLIFLIWKGKKDHMIHEVNPTNFEAFDQLIQKMNAEHKIFKESGQ